MSIESTPMGDGGGRTGSLEPLDHEQQRPRDRFSSDFSQTCAVQLIDGGVHVQMAMETRGGRSKPTSCTKTVAAQALDLSYLTTNIWAHAHTP